jgi:hypothetical protein
MNKINEEKSPAIYFHHQIRPPESLHAMNGWKIPFAYTVKYLYMYTIKAKALKTYIKIYSH